MKFASYEVTCPNCHQRIKLTDKEDGYEPFPFGGHFEDDDNLWFYVFAECEICRQTLVIRRRIDESSGHRKGVFESLRSRRFSSSSSTPHPECVIRFPAGRRPDMGVRRGHSGPRTGSERRPHGQLLARPLTCGRQRLPGRQQHDGADLPRCAVRGPPAAIPASSATLSPPSGPGRTAVHDTPGCLQLSCT